MPIVTSFVVLAALWLALAGGSQASHVQDISSAPSEECCLPWSRGSQINHNETLVRDVVP